MVNNTPLHQKTSALLTEIKAELPANSTITLGDLMTSLHERGLGLILLLFALPMALPLPVPPGINILLASPLLYLTAFLVSGKEEMILPDKLANREMKSSTLITVIEHASGFLKKVELIIKPRLLFLQKKQSLRIIGLFGFLMALTVCIPVPLTNTVPSFGLALIALGLINHDGFIMLAGVIVGIAWITMLLTAIIIFGPDAFEIIKNSIKSLI